MLDRYSLGKMPFRIKTWLSGVSGILTLIFLQRVSNIWLRIAGVTLIGFIFFLIIHRLVLERRRLLQLTTLDELTGLGNFRAYQERMRYEIQRARRKHESLTLILIDFDQFKKFNDTYGHRFGNELLQLAAQSFRESVRSVDGLFRFGGDEFAVILPETGLEEARRIATRMRHTFDGLDNRATVTLSMGMALYKEESMVEFFDRVDHLLYDVKANGGNSCLCEENGICKRVYPDSFVKG